MTAGERIQRNMSTEYCKDVCEYNVLMNQIESQLNAIQDVFKLLSNYNSDTDDSDLDDLKSKLSAQRKAKNLEGMMSVLGEMTNILKKKVESGVVGGSVP